VEDKISVLEDKIYTIKNTDEYIEKRMKKYQRNMQEICDSIKKNHGH
jgi:chaperonin cofactor prefoldin